MEAQARTFTTWPILGIYVWPNPWPYATTYAGEVAGLKSWVHSRLGWLDYNMPGICQTTSDIDYAETGNEFNIYPNPVADNMNVEYQTFRQSVVGIKIINQQGFILHSTTSQTRSAGDWTETFEMSSYKPGVYLLQLTIDGKSFSKRFIKI
jgi:hypothetical protein